MYLLTKGKDLMGKHLAQGHGIRTKRSRGPCAMTESQIFSRPAPDLTQSISTIPPLLHLLENY